MKEKGQNLVEFVIIVAVVIIGGIMVLTLLGGNVNALFTKSVNKTAEFKPFGVETDGGPADPKNPPTTGSVATEPTTITINGNDVILNPDGSASFTVGSQQVDIPSEAMANLNEVFMSTGSEGDQLTTEVLKAISTLIKEHKDEYPDGDVPINMSFGSGSRDQSDITGIGGGGNYQGDASFSSNSITLSVGNDVTLIQKDQYHADATTTDGVVHVIKGSIADIYNDGKTYFQGQISSTMPGMNGQTYTSFIPVTSATGNINGSIGGAPDGITGSWGFNFGGENYDL